LIIYDDILRDWALKLASSLEIDKPSQMDKPHNTFKANDFWVYHFKKKHRIVSRKIVKFTSCPADDQAEIEKKAETFVDSTKLAISNINPILVINSDQSGFNRCHVSKGTLTHKGEEKTIAFASNLNALTHSYTVQIAISMEHVLPIIYVVSQEQNKGAENGQFGPRVTETMFTAPNLVVSCSKSGKCQKRNVKDFNEVLLKSINQSFSYLIDSWTDHE
jgi:hypothetical protein